ncbi:MAG: hypothetical protein RLZZ142_689 [Verrucomicrobiota bacterium]
MSSRKFLVLAMGILLGGAVPADAASVEISKSEFGPAGDSKGANTSKGTAISVTRVLKLEVRNLSEDVQKVTVRYWCIGRDMKTMSLKVMEGDEKSVDLKSRGVAEVVSDEVKSEYHVKSSFTAAPAAKGKAAPAAKPPQPAGGLKLMGYGVQVIREGKVLAERFSDPSLKKVVGGGEGDTPAPLYKAGADQPDAEAKGNANAGGKR